MQDSRHDKIIRIFVHAYGSLCSFERTGYKLVYQLRIMRLIALCGSVYKQH